MSAPEWLKWVTPAPNADEVAPLIEQFGNVVEKVERRILREELEKKIPSIKEQSLSIEAALGKLQGLPSYHLDLPEIMLTTERLKSELNWLGTLPPKAEGQPKKSIKRWCLVLAYVWLRDSGKETSDGMLGSVPNIARAIWDVASIDDHYGIKTWDSMWQRMKSKVRDLRTTSPESS